MPMCQYGTVCTVVFGQLTELGLALRSFDSALSPKRLQPACLGRDIPSGPGGIRRAGVFEVIRFVTAAESQRKGTQYAVALGNIILR